jgi:hypothetical protein
MELEVRKAANLPYSYNTARSSTEGAYLDSLKAGPLYSSNGG